MNDQISNFNIRVYGILIENNSVLITDELRSAKPMTKFPGGGLEKGEGLSDCLIREFEEELGIIVDVGKLFYVNDFLQVSAFSPNDQLISFYYFVSTPMSEAIKLNQQIEQVKDGDTQLFRWREIDRLNEVEFTFPLDKIVGRLLGEWYS